jgi:hypothetical protein
MYRVLSLVRRVSVCIDLYNWNCNKFFYQNFIHIRLSIWMTTVAIINKTRILSVNVALWSVVMIKQ